MQRKQMALEIENGTSSCVVTQIRTGYCSQMIDIFVTSPYFEGDSYLYAPPPYSVKDIKYPTEMVIEFCKNICKSFHIVKILFTTKF